MNTPSSKWRANPVLWLTIVLPAAAVAASFASLYASLRGGDVPLPENYHWEGQALAGDQANLQRAAVLGISAQLRYNAATHECELGVQPLTAATTLRLTLTHPTEPALDQHLQMQRTGSGSGSLYRAACSAPAAAHWWAELSDPGAGWMLRARIQGDFSTPRTLNSAEPPA